MKEPESEIQEEASDTWPSLTFEQRPWEPSVGDYGSRKEMRAHRGPYEAAVPAAIAALDPDLGIELLAAVEDATTEITRFDMECAADLAPFAALLLRSESTASSQIENLTASAKAIAAAELGDHSRKNASMIVANASAMNAAIDLADRLDGASIIEMHRALLGESHPEWVGHWRDEQVWIGGSRIGPHTADYVAPHHDRVPSAISDLVAFMDRDDMPVLVQAAIAHAQFETIHPFPDGNGRVGRALVHSLLRSKGTTRSVTVPISAGLLTNRDAYFEALETYRAGNPQPIVARFADAAHAAIANGRHLTDDLRTLRAQWNQRIVARTGAAAWRLADTLTQQPVINAAFVQTQLKVTDVTAASAIKTLVDADVLSQAGGGKRYRVWAAVEVLDALDAFAMRAGRRSRS